MTELPSDGNEARMTESPAPSTPRIPRALQVLLLLLGVQIAARVWPTTDADAQAADGDRLEEAAAAISGAWVGDAGELHVAFAPHEVTLTRGGRSQTVGYEIREVRQDAIVLTLAHDPPVERMVCLFDDRLDIDCPTGIWLEREGA